jgi:hypothetical protein
MRNPSENIIHRAACFGKSGQAPSGRQSLTNYLLGQLQDARLCDGDRP